MALFLGMASNGAVAQMSIFSHLCGYQWVFRGSLLFVYLCGQHSKLGAWIHKGNVQRHSVLIWSKIKQSVVLVTTFLLIFSVQPSWASTEQSINNYGIGINLLSKTSSKDFSKIQQDLMNVYLTNDEILDGFDKIGVPDEQFNDYLHDLVALNNSREIVLSSMTDLENTYNTNFSSKIPSEVDSAIESGVDDIFKRGDEEVSAYWSGFQDRHFSLNGFATSFAESTQMLVDAKDAIVSGISAIVKIRGLLHPKKFNLDSDYPNGGIELGLLSAYMENEKEAELVNNKITKIIINFGSVFYGISMNFQNGKYNNADGSLDGLKLRTDLLGFVIEVKDLSELLLSKKEFKKIDGIYKILEDINGLENSLANANKYADLLSKKDMYRLGDRDVIFANFVLAHESFLTSSLALKIIADTISAIAPKKYSKLSSNISIAIDAMNDTANAIQSGFFLVIKPTLSVDHYKVKNKLEIARIYARTFQDVNLFVAKKLGDAVLSYYPTLFTEVDGKYSYDLDKVIYHFTNNIKVINVNNVELVDLPNEWKSGDFSVSVKFCGDDTNTANLLFKNASSSTTKSMSYALSGAVDLGGGCRKYNISVDGWSIYDHTGGNADVSLSVSVAETASPIYTKRLVDMNDTDNDKLPDSWENDYFKSLGEVYHGDFDADGFSNGYEYWHHTDPTKKGSDGILNSLVLKPTQYRDGTWNYNCSLAGNYWSNVTVDGCNVTVDGNSSIAGRLTMNSGALILNGKSLSVGGSFLQAGGTLNVNGGKLVVTGDYRIQSQATDGSYTYSYGTLYMVNPADRVVVQGDFVMDSSVSHGNYKGVNYLSAGVLEIKGNFTQLSTAPNSWYLYGDAPYYNFHTSGTHRVLLSGTGKQVVNFMAASSDRSHFTELEFFNNPANVTFMPGDYTTDKLIYAEDTLSLADLSVSSLNFTLQKDIRIKLASGDAATLQANTLDLNGHTLTIEGDFIHSGGTLNVNGGKLIVTGDYRIQSQATDGSYTYSYGTLYMVNAADRVVVQGDFVMDSSGAHGNYKGANYLSAGVLEIKGNFTQLSTAPNSWYLYGDAPYYNFHTSGTHRVVLSGADKQVVSLATPSYSHLINLWLINNSGVEFKTPITISGLFEHNRNPFTLADATNSSFVDFDGDGVKDNLDPYPQDKTNTAPDSDKDGVADDKDAFPNDPKETLDTDKDGIGNNADPDDDNDGISDSDEATKGTDPLKADTDGDGVNDKDDVFPLDATESKDADKDNIGDNKDPDDDNDGMPDVWETQYGLNPLDASDASQDKDGDTLSNLDEYKKDTDPTKKDDLQPVVADLAVTLTNPSTITPDTLTKHTITVTNNGKAAAEAVVLNVDSPADEDSTGKSRTQPVALNLTQGTANCPLSHADNASISCISFPPTKTDTFNLGTIPAGQTATVEVTNRYSGYAAGNTLKVSANATTSTAETITTNNTSAQAFTLQAKRLVQGCDYRNMANVSPYPQTGSRTTNHFHALTFASKDTSPITVFGYSDTGEQAILNGDGFQWSGIFQNGTYPSNIWAVAKADTGTRHVGVSLLGGLFWSDDRITWTPVTAFQGNALNDIAYAKGRYVAVGAQGTILTSVDGINWQQATSGTTAKLAYVDTGNNEFVVGGQGVILSSTDGLVWATRATNTGQDASALEHGAVWNGSQYLLFDSAGNSHLMAANLSSLTTTVAIKPTVDGVTEVATVRTWSAIYWQDNQYIALTTQGLLTSSDGRAWTTQQAIAYPYTYQRLADKAVIAGAHGSIWAAACAPVSVTPPPTLNYFVEQKDVFPVTVVESNTLTVSGLAGVTPLTITGGEYRKNGAAYTKAKGTVQNGDTLQVRHTTSSKSATAVTTTVKLGKTALIFKSTTLVIDSVPDVVSFNSQTDVPSLTWMESNVVTVSGVNAPIAIREPLKTH
ncbi:hypothetical protein [Thiothrix winogradskyi]|uniref:DUF11 domain-containing protein n=1 Tax=Thiothrix winogradskyi TaxID=96472 RepID=A0ABY3T451_9GAMM|nr:hypothetical protein [Thiothrix winogradskyi]UJS26638.1 hypothetical protein L2Y54_15505 [Thiothrix winogradskyi]